MGYWAVARLEFRHEAFGLDSLWRAGFEPYYPRLRETRVHGGRKAAVTVPLFLGYVFITIEMQWHMARWAPGVLGLIMDGERPARVPDHVIAELRGRERNGLVPSRAAASPAGRSGPAHPRPAGGRHGPVQRHACWRTYRGAAVSLGHRRATGSRRCAGAIDRVSEKPDLPTPPVLGLCRRSGGSNQLRSRAVTAQ
jgi:hypothetical protein